MSEKFRFNRKAKQQKIYIKIIENFQQKLVKYIYDKHLHRIEAKELETSFPTI